MQRTKILARPDGWPMRSADIYRALGIEGNRLPDHGLPVKLVQGIAVVVEPRIEGTNQDGNRVRAQCELCRRWFGFARLRQHMEAHNGDSGEAIEAMRREAVR